MREQTPDPQASALQQKAAADAAIWHGHSYFDEAERYMQEQWEAHVWPMIHDCDFTAVLDLAAGHGRNSERLAKLSKRLVVGDILPENVEFCRNRLLGRTNVEFVLLNGVDLHQIENCSLTLVYCFDAMVHFDSDVVRSYLREFRRVLVPGGRAFCHHSNYTERPGADFRLNPGARNFMSQAMFKHYASKEGLQVVKSRTIHWMHDDSDCLTVCEVPAG